MPKFQKPCLRCGGLSYGSYCETHQREINQAKEKARDGSRRKENKSRLYNYAYRKEAQRVKAEATHCHLCGKPFLEGDKVEADHLIPGLIDGPLGAAHARCNQSRGNRPLA